MKIHGHYTIALVLLLLLVSTFSATAQDAKSIAVLISVRGLVEVDANGEWTPAKFGQVLDDGARLRTGADGFASIVFTDDKTQVKFRPGTLVTLNATRDQEDYTLAKRVNMDVGQLFADVQEQKGSMRVATPNSVASVKGTQFWVLFGSGQSQVLTLDGLVQVLSLVTGQSSDVGAGFQATVGDDGTITTGSIEEGQLPDTEDVGEPSKTIEIRFTDEDGNVKTMTIDVFDTNPENE